DPSPYAHSRVIGWSRRSAGAAPGPTPWNASAHAGRSSDGTVLIRWCSPVEGVEDGVDRGRRRRPITGREPVEAGGHAVVAGGEQGADELDESFERDRRFGRLVGRRP